MLLAFFVSSVVLSRIGKTRKRGLVDIGKAGARDAMQVLANGGVATLCAVVSAFVAAPLRWAWVFAFAGAYAAATADTWGTEIGTLVRGRPRSLFTLRPIPTGLSGGITLAGTLAEAAGAVWIAFVTLAAFLPVIVLGLVTGGAALPATPITVGLGLRDAVLVVTAIPLAGFLGAMLDSALGATIQELRRCEACARTCETNPHVCGAPTRLVRGLPGASNDVVNFAATLAGAAIAFALV